MNKKDKIIDIISTILNTSLDENCIYETENLWDSITHIEIIVAIEEEFGVHIPEDKIPYMTSVKNILEVLEDL